MSERDRSIEDLLRQGLGTTGEPGPAAACLDADVVAAWLDGGLSPDEVAAAEAHASSCARCQALLAAAVRTEPALPVPESRWSWIQAVRWAIPLTAAAAAVAIWIAVTPREPTEPPVPTQMAEHAARSAPAETPAPPPAPVQAPPDTSANPRGRRPVRGVDDKDRQDAAFAGRSKAELADRGGAALRAPNQTLDSVSAKTVPPASSPAPPTISSRDAGPPPAAASASPAEQPRAPTTPPATPPPVPSTEVASQARGEAFVQERSLVGKPAGLAGAVGGAGRGGAAAVREVAFTGPVEVSSPDPLYRWRTRAPSVVERSMDGGRTWDSQPVGSAGVVSSGSSPSPSICWLAGRAGYVVVSTDGRTWRRRPFPEAVDLIDIRAVDAAAAVATTTDGRRFGTTDGGSTWTPR